jgi:hypothetical protein
VLNDAINALTSKSTFFWTTWKALMKKYFISTMTHRQQTALHSLYRHFEAAVMDFVDLQDLPYAHVLRCKCAVGHQYLSADALMVCCKRQALCVCGPWLKEQPGTGEPLVEAHFPSEYADCFAILHTQLRQDLRAATAASGCDNNDVVAPQQECAELEASNKLRGIATALTTIVDGNGLITRTAAGSQVFNENARKFLRELSANSPACAIAHASDLAPLQRWMFAVEGALAATHAGAAAVASEEWTGSDMALMDSSVPCLAPCAKEVHLWATQHRNAELCHAFVLLAEELVWVRHAFGVLLARGLVRQCCLSLFCSCTTSVKQHASAARDQCLLFDAVWMITQCWPKPHARGYQLCTGPGVLQATISCHEAKKQPEALPQFQPRDLHAKTHRNVPARDIRSEQEGCFRTGVFSSAAGPADAARGMGRRQYPLLAVAAQLLKHEDTNCTKKQYSSGRLSPGLMVRCPLPSRAVSPADI